MDRRDIVQKIKQEFLNERYDIIYVDRVKVIFEVEKGWALIRSSNTGL